MMLIPLIFTTLFVIAHWLRFQSWQMSLLLGIGVVIGWGFYWLDSMVLAKRYTEPGLSPKPVSRTLWMLLLYWPLAIFVATSTGSMIGLGLILGLGAGLTWDVFRLLNAEAEFKTYFNIPVTSQLNQLEIQVAGMIWCLGFLILTFIQLL